MAHVKLLHTYLYQANIKAEAHTAASAVNRRHNKATAVSQGISSLIVGVLGVATWNGVDDCGSSTNLALIATGTVLSFLAASIGVVRSVWRFAAKEANHHSSAGNYADIASDIELFLAGNLTDPPVEHFTETTHACLDIYDQTAATIPERYIEAAKRKIKFPKNGLSQRSLRISEKSSE